MNPLNPELAAGEFVEVSRVDRWSVGLRLWELGITCQCVPDQPLRVEINTVVAAVQLWSVVRQLTSPRQDLVHRLERCWNYT